MLADGSSVASTSVPVRTTMPRLLAFVAEGMAADLNVHWALRPDGQPKLYAQILLTMRRIEAEGFGFKERAWNDRAAALRWRQLWAVMANICLAAQGYPARIDHRSYAGRGIALEPRNKIGPNAARRSARGKPSERVDENHATARRNAERSAGRTDGKQPCRSLRAERPDAGLRLGPAFPC